MSHELASSPPAASRRAFVTRVTRSAALAALGLGLAACGSSSNDADPIWPSNATELVVVEGGGGFAPGAPRGSKCPVLGEGSFRLSVAKQRLFSHVCTESADKTYEYVEGEHTLTGEQYQRVEQALQKLSKSEKTACAEDGTSFSIKVTSPVGEREYLDSFNACEKRGTYVDGMGDVFQLLEDLMGGPQRLTGAP